MRTIARFFVLTMVVAGCGAESSSDNPDAGDTPDGDVCSMPDAGVGETCATSDDCTCGTTCSGLRCVAPAACNEALLSWDGPVANTDGSCLTDLGGFKVRWGTTMGGPYDNEADVMASSCAMGEAMACGDAGETVTQLKCSYRLTDLPNGTVYITVASYSTTGVESVPTGEASKMIACP
ncbi:MAG TPA: hypothetical protein VM513_08665 [Kofleriaceae bacterium]|nr:hypothetical protein [Kofleriaceae bacterium]